MTDEPELIAEAARLVKPGGTTAFTDWVEGTASAPTRRTTGVKITPTVTRVDEGGVRPERLAPALDRVLVEPGGAGDSSRGR